MAKHTPTTPFGGHEAPPETTMSRAFRKAMTCMNTFIAAERDLEDVAHSQDPAYAAWASEAELAHEYLADALIVVHSLPVEIREDAPLRRMALLADAMIGHEEPGGARDLHLQMQLAFFTVFQAKGIGPVAMHRNGLLVQARHLVTAMIELPLFDGETEVNADHPSSTDIFGNVF